MVNVANKVAAIALGPPALGGLWPLNLGFRVCGEGETDADWRPILRLVSWRG